MLKGDIIEIVETLGVIALYSISFTRSTEVGDYIEGFSGTPPSRIDFTDPTGTGGWFTSGTISRLRPRCYHRMGESQQHLQTNHNSH